MNFIRKSFLSIVVLIIIIVCGGGSEGIKKDENIEIIIFLEVSNVFFIFNVGSDIIFDFGDIVIFDGLVSIDIDGDDLSFIWIVESVLVLNMNIESVVYLSFIFEVEGIYEISLIVNDGKVSSEKDYVEVMVIKLNFFFIVVINGLGFGK